MKKTIQIVLVLVGLVTAALNGMDALFWLDPTSGFPLQGGLWLRYGGAAVLFLLAGAVSLLASQRVADLIRKQNGIALTAALTGVIYALTSAMHLTEVVPVVQQLHAMGRLSASAVLSGCGGALFLAVAGCLGAWALFTQSAFWHSAVPGEYPAGGVYASVLMVLYPAGLAFERFLGHTSSIYRVYHIWQLLSVLLAMLFLLGLVRVSFFPETGRSRGCVRSGLAAFYSCTCCELVFTLCQWKQGLAGVAQAADSLLLAAIGLLGLCCALHMIAPEAARQKANMD